MSDFPKRGDVEATRAWLERNGLYRPQLTNWNAEALLGLQKEDIIFLVGNQFEGLRLWSSLEIARQTPSPGAIGRGGSTGVDATAEEIPSSSYLTPLWVEAMQHDPGRVAAVASEETKGSVWKARRYATKIEELRASFHRKRNEKYYCAVETEDAIEQFRIYYTSRSHHSVFPIFQCPLHQVFLRDCYVHFRLCNHDMAAFAEFLSDNGGILPSTGLPLSPEGQRRNYLDPELRTFKSTHYN